METIRVNMTPCEDIKTIHASQNDGEAREWGFELHNNGEKIDSSSISDQLVFKAYKGGTEQILPTNGSTPTTSPFLGDIKYPDELRENQYFTYRECPSTSGEAEITSLKGNTLVWNQLVRNGNFADTSNWGTVGSPTFTVSNNEATVTISNFGGIIAQNLDIRNGHKYLIILTAKSLASTSFRIGFPTNIFFRPTLTTQYQTFAYSVTASADGNTFSLYQENNFTTVYLKNVMLIDLTMLNDSRITDFDSFKSYYPLDYYDYNAGTLLSFNGTGIKTVGKNLIKNVRIVGHTYSISGVSIVPQADGSFTLNGTCNGNNVLNIVITSGVNNGVLFLKGSYVLSGSVDGISSSNVELQYYIPSIGSGNRSTSPISFTLNAPMDVAIRIYVNNGRTYNNDVVYPMLRFANVDDSTFEPYTSSTLSLPISTYFPNGMKSAENAYDELSNTKASTRIGSITVDGSEAWIKSTSYNGNYYVLGIIRDAKAPSSNAMSNRLKHVYGTSELSANDLCFMFDGSANSQNVNIKNTSMATVDQFKAWLQANPVTIYYELATPTETSFTTASLVTENAEIPLTNEDGVLIGKCTEQLSSESGFFDAKIKLADEDGECYSNKFQLHVERSPQ